MREHQQKSKSQETGSVSIAELKGIPSFADRLNLVESTDRAADALLLANMGQGQKSIRMSHASISKYTLLTWESFHLLLAQALVST
jgi:hypothetical protein